ncbi:MAG: SpoIIIAH-like family protein [Lachnospiraceae bacterium]|nr:SpoIIIAH-like family protein [Lachnospiraceae bacterium]
MIITTLAIMVAIAGYLNYSGQILEETADTVSSDDSTVLLTDEIEENTYVDTYTDIVSLDGDGLEDSASGEGETSGTTEAAVGEAVLASTSVSSAGEILAAAKLSREQVRSKSKEELQEIIDSADLTEEEKQEAVAAMTTLTVNAQKESAAELLLEASGYTDCVVSMTEDTVDVVVNASSLTEAQRAQIEDIVKRKTEVAGEKIVITPAAATVSETAAAESAGADAAAEDTESAEAVSVGETEQ